MKILILFFCFMVLLGACASEEDIKISKALKLAGENRGELEKVLRHYTTNSADSLKLRAARFLIANMPGHYTLTSKAIEGYRTKIYADSSVCYRSKKEVEISLGLMENLIKDCQRLPDVESLSSVFLIRHIDAVFEIKEKYAWLQDITFDIFLEYLLPYRLLYEKPDYWRDSLQVIPEHWSKRLFDTDEINSFTNFFLTLRLQESGFRKWELIPELLTREEIYNDCRILCYCHLFEARAKGVPVMMDFIPHYSNRNGYHYWLMNPPFQSKNYNIHNAFDRRTAKVYRRTFSHNPIPEPASGEYIPSFFLDPFNKDVTNLYFYTQDIHVPVREKISVPRYHTYLCVFNNLAWAPIAIGHFSGNQAVFNNMCRNVAYLPVVYKEEKEQAINYPFILKLDHSVRELIPDTTHLQKVRLVRKNSARSLLRLYNDAIAGTVIEASLDRNFKHADTIFKLETSEPGYYYSVEKENSASYRFLRVIPPRKTVDISELIFYDTNGQKVAYYVDPSYKRVADDNVLTHIILPRDSVLFLQFDKPVSVQRMVCLPRSDGNGIYPGNVYELLYYDLEGWCSLGEKVATDFYIEYDDVPSGALYWLRNLSGGVEERIFTWENGIQHFW